MERHRQDGTDRPDRDRVEPEFKSGDGFLEPPKEWDEDSPEREEWDRIVPELVRCNIAKSVHQGILEGICELYGEWKEHRKEKEYSKARLARAEYRKALNEFGLTPATAGRVGGATAIDNEDEEAEEFDFTGPRAVND